MQPLELVILVCGLLNGQGFCTEVNYGLERPELCHPYAVLRMAMIRKEFSGRGVTGLELGYTCTALEGVLG